METFLVKCYETGTNMPECNVTQG